MTHRLWLIIYESYFWIGDFEIFEKVNVIFATFLARSIKYLSMDPEFTFSKNSILWLIKLLNDAKGDVLKMVPSFLPQVVWPLRMTFYIRKVPHKVLWGWIRVNQPMTERGQKLDFESFLSVRVIYDHRMDVSVVSIMLNGDIFYIVYHELIKLRNFRGKIEVKISSCNMNGVKIGSVYDSEASNLRHLSAIQIFTCPPRPWQAIRLDIIPI